MAGRAGITRVLARRDREPRVVERPLAPRRVRRPVARLARRREPRRHVVRIPRRLVLRQVAPGAGPRRSPVDPVLVARRARRRRVPALQRERRRVVERPLAPRRVRRPVARLARRREPRGLVVRVLRRLVLRQVAPGAVPRRSPVDPVLVARRARLGRVVPDEREHRRVIERPLAPGQVRRLVTGLARRRESRGQVIRVLRRLVLRQVARHAVAREPLEDPVLVARGAERARVPAQEGPPRVVERPLRPGGVGDLVTGFTRRREPRGEVVRVHGPLVVGLVARGARRREPLEHAAPMAGRARLDRVLSRERPLRMIERHPRPRRVRRLVARFARRRESRQDVARVRRLLEQREVAPRAVAGRAAVDTARVTRGAGLRGVPPDEGEGAGVVELALLPRRVGDLVARFARRREPRGGVVRVRGFLVVGLVARDARRPEPLEDAAPVARRAGLARVPAHEGPLRVVERDPLPRRVRGPVARLARRREPRLDVARVRRLLVLGDVTPRAVARRPAVDAVLVAGRAGRRRVLAGEREGRLVVKAGLLPGRVGDLVARLARGREPRRNVVRVLRPVVVLPVAADAARRLALPEETARVALLAVDSGVRTGECEAGRRGVAPGDGGPRGRPVAVLAVEAQPGLEPVVLSAVPVAVGAEARRPLRLPLDVAGRAGDEEVLALERPRRLVESARGALPGPGGGVAALAARTERPLVRVLVARRARGLEPLVADRRSLASRESSDF